MNSVRQVGFGIGDKLIDGVGKVICLNIMYMRFY